MIVSIQNVSKQFHQQTVVNGISLEVEEGDLVALIGPSGCGKSTLLRCINGLEALDAGQVQVYQTSLQGPHDIGEKEFHRRAQAVRQQVGMVFQSFNLFPHLTILENIMKAPCVVRNVNEDEAEKTARELLIKVGLGDKADHYPNQLSGGMQQRAAIARALAMNPK